MSFITIFGNRRSAGRGGGVLYWEKTYSHSLFFCLCFPREVSVLLKILKFSSSCHQKRFARMYLILYVGSSVNRGSIKKTCLFSKSFTSFGNKHSRKLHMELLAASFGVDGWEGARYASPERICWRYTPDTCNFQTCRRPPGCLYIRHYIPALYDHWQMRN